MEAQTSKQYSLLDVIQALKVADKLSRDVSVNFLIEQSISIIENEIKREKAENLKPLLHKFEILSKANEGSGTVKYNDIVFSSSSDKLISLYKSCGEDICILREWDQEGKLIYKRPDDIPPPFSQVSQPVDGTKNEDPSDEEDNIEPFKKGEVKKMLSHFNDFPLNPFKKVKKDNKNKKTTKSKKNNKK